MAWIAQHEDTIKQWLILIGVVAAVFVMAVRYKGPDQ